MIRNILLWVLIIVVMPAYTIYAVPLFPDIPQLEDDDTSNDEQNMLDIFEVEKPSFVLRLAHTLGSTIVVRYTLLKRTLQRRFRQVKKWWTEHKNKKEEKITVQKK